MYFVLVEPLALTKWVLKVVRDSQRTKRNGGSKESEPAAFGPKYIVLMQKVSTSMGLEPTTFGSEVRRAIHYATKPSRIILAFYIS